MKPLSSQEKSILELIGQGFSTRKIALILKISFHTVQSYRRALLLKFDASNSAELVRKSIESDGQRYFNSDTETSPL